MHRDHPVTEYETAVGPEERLADVRQPDEVAYVVNLAGGMLAHEGGERS